MLKTTPGSNVSINVYVSGARKRGICTGVRMDRKLTAIMMVVAVLDMANVSVVMSR